MDTPENPDFSTPEQNTSSPEQSDEQAILVTEVLKNDIIKNQPESTEAEQSRAADQDPDHPERAERLKNGIKLVIGAHRDTGKSVFAYELTRKVRELLPPDAVFRYPLTPDGEGASYSPRQDSTRLFPDDETKSNYSTASFAHRREVLEKADDPLSIFDLGGAFAERDLAPADQYLDLFPEVRNDPEADRHQQSFDMIKSATHGVILYKNAEELAQWREYYRKYGVTIIAEIKSELEPGATDDVHDGDVITGTAYNLERKSDLDHPAVTAVAQKLRSLTDSNEFYAPESSPDVINLANSPFWQGLDVDVTNGRHTQKFSNIPNIYSWVANDLYGEADPTSSLHINNCRAKWQVATLTAAFAEAAMPIPEFRFVSEGYETPSPVELSDHPSDFYKKVEIESSLDRQVSVIRARVDGGAGHMLPENWHDLAAPSAARDEIVVISNGGPGFFDASLALAYMQNGNIVAEYNPLQNCSVIIAGTEELLGQTINHSDEDRSEVFAWKVFDQPDPSPKS